MKAHYRTKSGQLTFEVQADNTKEIFKQVADLQQIFEAEDACGLCDSKNLRFQVRTIEDNHYHQLTCLDCRARFQFGQHKQGGGLYPKRKDPDGKWLPNGGWEIYVANARPAQV